MAERLVVAIPLKKGSILLEFIPRNRTVASRNKLSDNLEMSFPSDVFILYPYSALPLVDLPATDAFSMSMYMQVVNDVSFSALHIAI